MRSRVRGEVLAVALAGEVLVLGVLAAELLHLALHPHCARGNPCARAGTGGEQLLLLKVSQATRQLGYTGPKTNREPHQERRQQQHLCDMDLS